MRRGYEAPWPISLAATLSVTLIPATALAQNANASAVGNAGDAFGLDTGHEKVGVYSVEQVRGFSPEAAGNLRIEGLYFDQAGDLSQRLVDGSSIKVGLTAQSYPFPSPTGIVDYRLRSSDSSAALKTVAGLGDYAGPFGEIDLKMPILDDRLSLAAGFDYRDDRSADGTTERLNSQAAILTARFVDEGDLSIFWSRTEGQDKEAQPLVLVAGAVLPPDLPRRKFFGQNWTDRRFLAHNFGTLAHIALTSQWHLRAGIIRSTETVDSSFADIFRDTLPDGTARHVIVSDPPAATTSTSGELRISNAMSLGRLHQGFHLVLRARDRQSRYGGSGSIDIGAARIDQAIALPRQTFAFGQPSRDHVRQATTGLAYEARWARTLGLGLGIQKVWYDKAVEQPGGERARTRAKPRLFYGNFCLELTPRLTAYIGHTRGLEEAGVAPEEAANKGEALPAIHTRQTDAGLRYALTPDLKLVAAIFDVSKPYYNLDGDNVFTSLGEVNNQGIEVSLAGGIAPRLSVVAGIVLLRARVQGEAVKLGRVGSMPVGSSPQRFRANLEYALPSSDNLSLDLGLEFDGQRVASRDNKLIVPAKAQFDLGGRYGFRIGDVPMFARLLLENVTNEFGWRVSPSGGLRVNPGRRLTGYLTIDL